jgi:L-amino acid N-acyltransferase
MLADVYNHYVRTSTATFDTEQKSVADRLAWLAARDASHPVVVAESGGNPLGWGALSVYRERPAWQQTAEVAIYLAQDSTGKGVGRRILEELVSRARETELHVLVAQIVTENAASLSLFERAGFRRVGTMREVGRKFDRWLDIALFELVL